MESRFPSRTYGSVDDPVATRPPANSDDHIYSVTEEYDVVESKRGGAKQWIAVGAILAVVVGSVLFATQSGSVSSPGRVDESATTFNARTGASNVRNSSPRLAPGRTSHPEKLNFAATNFYHLRDGKPAQDYPWLKNIKLVEPHRETTLKVGNPREGHQYKWKVRNTDDQEKVIETATGAETVMVFKHLDENIVELEEMDATGVVSRTLTETVMCKYVRREIRTLTDEEREELLDAMFTLWDVRVQDGPGKELYGEDYADIWAINRLHYAAASPLFCDHFHDGLGFVTSHSLLSNTFEYSLQRVNPKLTLPYWDFTIEASSSFEAFGEEEPQAKSPLLSESWFGTNDPDDYMVKDGRWARTVIPKLKVNNPADFSSDIYSKLRSPWTLNNRAYLTRGLGEICGSRVNTGYPWPSCQTHYKLTTEYNTFYSWVWQSLYDPHGPVHVWLGGVVDCDETYAKIRSLIGEELTWKLSMISFVHRKNAFRNKIYKCTGSAQVSESPGDIMQAGTCGCTDFNLKDGDDYKQVMDTMVFLGDYLADFSEDVQRQVVATLCTGVVNDGDHLQSSSSLDPSFWPTHPTMERLFMFKRLTGTMTDLSWPDEDVMYEDEDGNVYRESVSLYSDQCVGHRGSDVFPFDLLDNATDFKVRTGIRGNSEGNTLTNREILEIMDPRANALSYVYDNFEWTHCTADGYDLKDTWKQPVEASSGEHSETTGLPPTKTTGTRATVPGGTTIEERMNGNSPVFRDGEMRFPLYKSLKTAMVDTHSKP